MGTDISTNPRQLDNPGPQGRRRWLAGIGVALAVGAASLSIAQAEPPAPGDGGGPSAHRGRFGGDGFMAFRVQRVLEQVGATDSQKSQVKAIWTGLRPQLQTLHQQHAQLRRQIEETMTAATIDTAAVEKLRRQSVQLMDKTSSLITQGMVSTAQVLTPDQRKRALAEIQSHHGHHGPAWND